MSELERLEKRNGELRAELTAALNVCEAVAVLYGHAPRPPGMLSDLINLGRVYKEWREWRDQEEERKG